MPPDQERDLTDEGQSLLDELHLANLDMVQEKRRLELVMESRVTAIEKERNRVQATIALLEPSVSQDRATEEDEVEYVLALFQRLELDEEYADLREAVATLNLPAEADNLSGELGEVDPSPEEADVEA